MSIRVARRGSLAFPMGTGISTRAAPDVLTFDCRARPVTSRLSVALTGRSMALRSSSLSRYLHTAGSAVTSSTWATISSRTLHVADIATHDTGSYHDR